MNDAIRMQVSAFVDGELPTNEAEMLLRRMSQDAELRQQFAEYLATGRLLRGERSVAGMDRLRDRIAAQKDEKPLQEDIDVVGGEAPRFVRPLAGVAIAATVALAAIFGLQQNVFVAEETGASNGAVAGNAAEEIYTVPDATDEMLLEYRLRHGGSSLGLGDSSIDSRLVSQVREGQLIEVDASATAITDADEEDELVESADTSAAESQ
jgi:hypothetical protein